MQKSQALDAIWEFICKWWAWISIIGLNVMSKFGLYLTTDKKPSFMKMLGTLIIAISFGIISAIICAKQFPAPPGSISIPGAFIVSLVSISSDRLLIWVIRLDYSYVITRIKALDWNKLKDIF